MAERFLATALRPRWMAARLDQRVEQCQLRIAPASAVTTHAAVPTSFAAIRANGSAGSSPRVAVGQAGEVIRPGRPSVVVAVDTAPRRRASSRLTAAAAQPSRGLEPGAAFPHLVGLTSR